MKPRQDNHKRWKRKKVGRLRTEHQRRMTMEASCLERYDHIDCSAIEGDYDWDAECQEQEEHISVQQLVDPTPKGRAKQVPETMYNRVFCYEICDSFVILIGSKNSRHQRGERKILYVWYYPTIGENGEDIFQQLSKSDAVLAQLLSNPDPKYVCMSCHSSVESIIDNASTQEGSNEEDHQTAQLGHVLKIVAASPTSLDVWHIFYSLLAKPFSMATVMSHMTVSLSASPSSLAWSSDGACIFSGQRNKINIWDSELNRIGSIKFGSQTSESSIPIQKLLYLHRPKEIIIAIFENGLVQGWFLEEGCICLSAMISSVSGRDQSRGVPYQRNDPLTEIQVLAPSIVYSSSNLPNSASVAKKMLAQPSKKQQPRHVGHILPSTTPMLGQIQDISHVFCTIIACFQSGRVKKIEVEILSPQVALQEDTISRVREIASVDLQKELRFRQSSLPSTGVEDMVLKREQPANVLSITILTTPNISSAAAVNQEEGASSITVGYLALLSDCILVLNRNLVVLDMITTDFKGLISMGNIHVPPISNHDINLNPNGLHVEAVAISSLTNTVHAVYCPLKYILNPSLTKQISTSSNVDELMTMASQLSLLSPTTSASAKFDQQQISSQSQQLHGPTTNTKKSISSVSKPPRAPSSTKTRPANSTQTISRNTLSDSDTLNIDVVTMVDLDFFASLPTSPSSPLQYSEEGEEGDDMHNEISNYNATNTKSMSGTTHRKSLSLLTSPDAASLTNMTHALQKQQQQQQQLMRTKAKGDWEKPMKDAQGRLINQPVTFHTRIKSSGYGQQPQDLFTKKMLQRQKEKEKEKKLRSSSAPRLRVGYSNSNNNNSNNGGGRLRLYPLHCQAMQTHLPIWDYPEKSSNSAAPTVNNNYTSPIFHMVFSSDASRLALATSSSVALTLRLPRATAAQRDVTAFMGHNHSLQTVSLSYHKQPEYLLLTASKDETARIWKASRSEQASVLFSHHRHQPSAEVAMTMTMNMLASTSVTASAATSVSSAKRQTQSMASTKTLGGGNNTNITSTSSLERNRPFGCEIKHAQFYYQDRFVLLSHKANVGMYSYQLDRSDSTSIGSANTSSSIRRSTTMSNNNELTRFLHHGSYRRKHVWEFATTANAHYNASTSSVTALTAMNSVHSPLILVATADKSIHILDANCGRILRSIPQAHEKSVTCLSVSQPSPHAPLPRDAHQVFLSLAPDNVLCLWDLRQATPVLRYTQHVHRREVLHANFSPCMKYFGAGSEDRTGRLFDMVAGKEAMVLTGHRDVVTCVAFNPLFAQVATASYDGTVRFYADMDCPLYTSAHI